MMASAFTSGQANRARMVRPQVIEPRNESRRHPKTLKALSRGISSARRRFDVSRSHAVPAFIGGGAALQVLTGALLVRRFVGLPTALATEKEVFRFSLAASASCLVTPTIAVMTLWLARLVSSADFLTNWVTWYVGDSIGTLIFAPLVWIWTFRTADWRRKLSITVPMAFTLTVVVALFFQTNRC